VDAQVERVHFGSQQHNKVLMVRGNVKAMRALAGSTTVALGELHIQANNALLFEVDNVAGKSGELFDRVPEPDYPALEPGASQASRHRLGGNDS